MKITIEDIESNILREHYINVGVAVLLADQRPAPEDLVTVCVLVLKNGFSVVGSSACVSPENYDEAIGRSVARDDAIDKVWPLMGYQLKDALHMAENMTQADLDMLNETVAKINVGAA